MENSDSVRLFLAGGCEVVRLQRNDALPGNAPGGWGGGIHGGPNPYAAVLTATSAPYSWFMNVAKLFCWRRDS